MRLTKLSLDDFIQSMEKIFRIPSKRLLGSTNQLAEHLIENGARWTITPIADWDLFETLVSEYDDKQIMDWILSWRFRKCTFIFTHWWRMDRKCNLRNPYSIIIWILHVGLFWSVQHAFFSTIRLYFVFSERKKTQYDTSWWFLFAFWPGRFAGNARVVFIPRRCSQLSALTRR